MTTTDKNDILWLMASMRSSPYLNTGTLKHESSLGNSAFYGCGLTVGGYSNCGMDCGIVETDKVNHIVEMDIVKLMVEIENFGKSSDEFDKETRSSDGLQPKQADLSCIHALSKLYLHEIHFILSMHEANQY
nr:hypothetical protein [Tanacetum cinerariifolium]